MAYEFVVEDGTGVVDATSYASVSDADDYATFIDEQDWFSLTAPSKERYLQLATMFVDNLLNWAGDLLTDTQSLNFPREEFQDMSGRVITGLPDVISLSTIQLAISSMEHELTVDPIRLKSQAWGSTKEEYSGEYAEDGAGVLDVKKNLARLGYGSTTTFITAQRA